MTAQGPFIRQAGGVAIFSGQFQIVPTVGPGVQPLFVGQMELYDPIGTHHNPAPGGEPCNAHPEGWLVGEGQTAAGLQNYAIHLEIALAPITGVTLRGVVNGVVIRCT